MTILRHAVLMLLLMGLGACDGEPSTSEPPTDEPSAKGCPNIPPNVPPKLVPININYNPQGITVAPDPACARLGDVLRFNLTPPEGALVAVKGKTSEDEWLKGAGKNHHFFVIVPLDLLPKDVDEKDFSYGVTTDDLPPLDPVVTVHRW